MLIYICVYIYNFYIFFWCFLGVEMDEIVRWHMKKWKGSGSEEND